MSTIPSTSPHPSAAELMDEQYRYQRYIYDWSRKYYLFGRDALLNEIQLERQDTLLEIGCGTGRNLIKLHKRYPHNALYGVDASRLMLEQANHKLSHHPHSYQVILKQGLAQDLTLKYLHRTQGFDHIVFSYVLSMIPEWQTAFNQALLLLKPNGTVHLVDFADQSALPSLAQQGLKHWLNWFNVHPDPTVPTYLSTLAQTPTSTLKQRFLLGRYAFIAHYTPRNTL
ncbi:MAG: hypothetical protein RLZZ422_2885 [Pseudomonadota bacterium]